MNNRYSDNTGKFGDGIMCGQIQRLRILLIQFSALGLSNSFRLFTENCSTIEFKVSILVLLPMHLNQSDSLFKS